MKRISTYLLIGLFLLLQSCLKEDLSTCKSELLLRFRYTLNDQYVNLFDSEVHRVTLFVFDQHGKYVDRFTEQGDQLTNDYVMHVPLPEGKYSVVAYGGNFTTYSAGEINNQTNTLTTLRKGVTDMHDFRAELKSINGTDDYIYPASTPDDLYAGWTVEAISSLNNQTIKDVELIKDTKKIKVKITGTNSISGPLDVSITALNGRCLFDNNLDLKHRVFKYPPINAVTQPDYMEVDLKILRLMLGQSPMLVIKNAATSETLFNENMIDLILSTHKYISQEDFDREDEFVFEIVLTAKESTITISVRINGWEIINLNPDL